MVASLRRSLSRAAWLAAALIVLVGLGLSAAAGAEARSPLPQCADNIDNDGDGRIDFPFEPGCTSVLDDSEPDPATPPVCSDGLDSAGSDGDAIADFPGDPGCSSASDGNENNPATLPQCGNGVDNDGDGKIDYPADPGCSWAAESSEADSACSDGIDNDGDGRADFPADFGCMITGTSNASHGVNDTNEENLPQCDDGRDNDGDGNVDVEQDVDCTSATDDSEAAVAPAPPPAPPPPPGPPPVSYVLPQTGDLGALPTTPAAAGGSSAARPLTRARLLSPFPIVRLRGTVQGRWTRVTLLSVRSPSGSKVTVYCSGRGCPARRVAHNAGRKAVRVRRFERRLRGGTILKVYVTKTGFVGKYTRFRFVSNRAPLRADLCVTKPGIKPKPCPS